MQLHGSPGVQAPYGLWPMNGLCKRKKTLQNWYLQIASTDYGGSSNQRVFNKDSPEASTDMSKTATASLDFAEFLQESLRMLKRNWHVNVFILQIPI